MSELPVLELHPDFGVQVTYEFNNQEHELLTGKTYVNALWEQPKASISFNKGWFTQEEYDYLKQFFEDVGGSAGTFKFLDPIDNYATNTIFESYTEAKSQGIIYTLAGQKVLAKKYQFGPMFVIRPIVKPVPGTIQAYIGNTPVSSDINHETGEINTTGTTWSGHFYITCTFENDTLPLAIVGYDNQLDPPEQTYSLPDLRLMEVKERLGLEDDNVNFVYLCDDYFKLPVPINTSVNRISKTDTFDSDSGYSVRTQIGEIRTEINIPAFILSRNELNYLLCLQRCTLGNWTAIRFKDEEAGFDNYFRSKESFTYKVLYDSHDDIDGATFEVQDMTFIQDDDGLKSSYCHVWKIIKANNDVVGFTNHDRDLEETGVVLYRANAGFQTTSANKTAEANTDSTEATSVFVDTLIEVDDLLTGQYDNASLDLNQYDWVTKTIVSRIVTARLGGHAIGYLKEIPKQFSIEGLSITDKLDSSRSIETSSQCRHKFLSQGYGNCNRPINSDVRQNATITAIVSDDTVTVSIPTSNYNLGLLTFTSGKYNGRSLYIASASGNNATFLLPLFVLPEVGDTCHLTRHCDKTIEACAGYNNAVNFGGQPRLPGVDETVARPDGV